MEDGGCTLGFTDSLHTSEYENMNLIIYHSRLDRSEFKSLFHVHIFLITLGGRHTSE